MEVRESIAAEPDESRSDATNSVRGENSLRATRCTPRLRNPRCYGGHVRCAQCNQALLREGYGGQAGISRD